MCTVCKEPGEAGRAVFKCRLASCGHFYHGQCLLDIQPHFACRVMRCAPQGLGSYSGHAQGLRSGHVLCL